MMDDKTKVQMCKEIISDFYDLAGSAEGEYRTVLGAVFTVLYFEGEEPKNGEGCNEI